jgi:hypothetical protein
MKDTILFSRAGRGRAFDRKAKFSLSGAVAARAVSPCDLSWVGNAFYERASSDAKASKLCGTS